MEGLLHGKRVLITGGTGSLGSDSGTVQEECCIFGVPTVTLRDVTERPETIECGSNILSDVVERIVLGGTSGAGVR